MRKALASIAVIAFTGLLCTSMLTVFSGVAIGTQYVSNQSNDSQI